MTRTTTDTARRRAALLAAGTLVLLGGGAFLVLVDTSAAEAVLASALTGLAVGASRGVYGFLMHRVRETEGGSYEVEDFDPTKLTRTAILYAIAGAVVAVGGGDPTASAIEATLRTTPIIVVAGEALNEFVPYVVRRARRRTAVDAADDVSGGPA